MTPHSCTTAAPVRVWSLLYPYGRPAGIPPEEDDPMLHALYYPRDLITERVRFTPADQSQITHCRGVHNRLGFAYQMGFVRLTGRFPAQQPLEMLPDLLVWVAQEVDIAPAVIEAYAQRRQTVSEHQLLLQSYLGLRPCGPAERDLLGHFLREEALRLESTPALIAQAEAFLRDRSIVLPASSTLRRVVGEQREQARHLVYTRLLALLPSTLPPCREALLQVEESHASSLQAVVYLSPADNPAGPVWSCPRDVNRTILTSHLLFPRPGLGHLLYS